MPSKVYSAAAVGVEAFEVEIEVHAGWGSTDKIAVVGLPDTAVKESKDRVTSAILQQRVALTVWNEGLRSFWRQPMSEGRGCFCLATALGMLKLEENNRLPALERLTGVIGGNCAR